MKIDSGLSSYNYNGRSTAIERKPEEAAQREADAPRRSGTPLIGSTLLSTSLANALWMVGDGKETSPSPTAGNIEQPGEAASTDPTDWVAELYREFGA